MGSADTDGAATWSLVLATMVSGHVPTDDREVGSKDRFLAELRRLGAPWDRDADPVHVTASALIVGHRGVVLHRHRRLGRWMQPGGHLEYLEAPSQGALRESEEETGLAVVHPPDGPRLVHLDVHTASAGHTHLDLRYLVIGDGSDPAPPPGESPDVRWCTWEEAFALADEALAGALVVAGALWAERGRQWLDTLRIRTSEIRRGGTHHER